MTYWLLAHNPLPPIGTLLTTKVCVGPLGPRLDHIFIRMGLNPSHTSFTLPGLLAHTRVGTLPHWEPM